MRGVRPTVSPTHPFASASIHALLLWRCWPTRVIPQRLEEAVSVSRATLLVSLNVDVESSLEERLVAVHAEQRLMRGCVERSEWQCERQ